MKLTAWKTPATAAPARSDTGGPSRIAWIRIGSILAGLVGLVLCEQAIWTAVSAAFGLAALAATALTGIMVFQLLPLAGQMLENRILAARKAEARRNPIEQLQNYLASKTAQVEAFRKAVAQIGAQIRSLQDMVTERRKTGRDTSKQEASIAAMRQAYDALTTKYKAAEAALTQLRETIEDKKFEFAFAKQGQIALNTLNSASGQNILDAMLADESFASIRDNFNLVFADLDAESMRLNDSRSIEHGGMTIDLPAMAHIPTSEELRK